jgi:5'-nucleotidase
MIPRLSRARFLFLFWFAVFVVVPAAAQQPASAPAPFTILLTNDDGYDAPGLRAMIEAMRAVGEVIVAAPATNQSGKGHSIVTSDPIFVTERKQPNGTVWYAIEATPATCARLAVEALLPRKPDLVISGINRGENVGIAVYYSGTVGAAREAVLIGVPAIAVSVQGNNDRDYAATAAYVRRLVEELRAKQMLVPGLFLNINAPAGEPKGVRITRQSVKPNAEIYERRTSPRGRVYFWNTYRPLADDDEGTDVWAFVRGYIAVTPMVLDVTDASRLELLRALERAGAAVQR